MNDTDHGVSMDDRVCSVSVDDTRSRCQGCFEHAYFSYRFYRLKLGVVPFNVFYLLAAGINEAGFYKFVVPNNQ